MTETTDNPGAQAPVPDKPQPSPGEFLRKLREEKGLGHTAVGEALHLTAHYIKALENDDYGKLPGLTFVKGYLRSYAVFLGADVAFVLALFEKHIASLLDAGNRTEQVQRTRRRHDQALRWAVGAGFVLVAGIVAGWYMMGQEQAPAAASPGTAPQAPLAPAPATVTATGNAVVSQGASSTVLTGTYTPAAPAAVVTETLSTSPEQTVTLLTTTEEVVTESAPEAGQEQSAGTEAVIAAANAEGPADSAIEQTQAGDDGALTETPGANGARLVSLVSTGEDVLRISFRGASWIEIDDGSMVRLYNDMMGAGDALTIRGEAPFHVLIGDATQVDVNLNAALVDISDDIREDSSARLVLEAAAMAGTETETAGVTP